jgi:uncharacterized protein YjbI with pentapeptide repeats
MEIRNLASDTLGFGCFPYRRSRKEWLMVVVLRGSWRIDHATGGLVPFAAPGQDAPMPCPVEGVDGDDAAAPVHPGSFAPFKPRADLCFDARAFAPAGKSATALAVSVGVGGWSKELYVVGDRRWRAGLLRTGYTDPQPFESMPLHLGHAFGGGDDDANPFGRGRVAKTEDGLGGLLPNVEWPGRMVGKPGDKVAPATFGPVPETHPDRARADKGRYDRSWLQSQWPGPPRDFDWEFFQAAPADQRVEGYLRGDETLRFVNLHPAHPVLECRLPALRARCFVERGDEAGEGAFEEVTLQLDTLWARPHEDRVELTWRGLVPVALPDAPDWRAVVCGIEPLDEAMAPETYRERSVAFAKEWDGQFDFEDEDLDGEPAWAAPIPPFQGPGPVNPEVLEVEERAEAQLQEARQEFLAEGRQAVLGVVEQSPAERAAVLRAAFAEDPAFFAAAGVAASTIEDLAGALEANGAEFAAVEAADAPDVPTMPPREALAAAHEAGEPLDGLDLDGVDLSGLDLKGARLAGASFDGADLSGADLSGAVLVGADFSSARCLGTKFVGADLGGASFVESDLTGADLSRARCVEADFLECVLADVRWGGVDLAEASLGKCTLGGLDLSGLHAPGASFDGVDLAGASLGEAVLRGTSWSKSILSGADLSDADLREADLSGCKLNGARLVSANLEQASGDAETDLTEAELTRARLDRVGFDDVCLERAVLRGASAKRAQFAAARLAGAVLDAADLSGASFDDAVLAGASLLKAKLLQAGLSRADCTAADFRGACLFDAGLDETCLDEARLQDADVGRTLLEVRR